MQLLNQPVQDQRIIQSERTWEQFALIRQGFENSGVKSLYRWRKAGYQRIHQSDLPELASLDIELLTQCVLIGQTSRLEAVKAFRNGMRPISGQADGS